MGLNPRHFALEPSLLTTMLPEFQLYSYLTNAMLYASIVQNTMILDLKSVSGNDRDDRTNKRFCIVKFVTARVIALV